jgi:LacI family transcriptional regulator
MGKTDGRQQVVGFVDDLAVLEPHLFFCLNAQLQKRGMILTPVDSRGVRTEGALEYCAEQRFAAAVVWSKTVNPDVARLRRVKQTMPIIAVDHALRGIETDVVGCNVFAGAKTAIRHLASLGHRRIGIVGALDSLDTTQERFAGYLEGMFEAGLQPEPQDLLFTRTSGSTPHTAALERRLSEPDRPDAVFVMQDHVLEDLTHAAFVAGLEIPTDLAVVSMGSDEPFAALPKTGLTTVAFDWAKMADAIHDRLCARFSDPGARPAVEQIPARLMVRGSCGAPREFWTEQPPLPISSTLRPKAGVRGLSDAPASRTLDRSYRPPLHREAVGTPKPSSLSSTLR